MSRGGDRTSTSARLAAAQRSRDALELRLRRLPYGEIARRLGYAGAGAAWHAVHRELAKVPRENAKALLTQELETLDRLQASVMDAALSGRPAGLWAIDRVLSIMDRRARLTGLYNVTDDGGIDEFKAVLRAWAHTLAGDDADEPGADQPAPTLRAIERGDS